MTAQRFDDLGPVQGPARTVEGDQESYLAGLEVEREGYERRLHAAEVNGGGEGDEDGKQLVARMRRRLDEVDAEKKRVLDEISEATSR